MPDLMIEPNYALWVIEQLGRRVDRERSRLQGRANDSVVLELNRDEQEAIEMATRALRDWNRK